MRLGICTRYCRHEAAYAAIRIADWASQYGADVTMLNVTPTPVALSPRWDRETKRHAGARFTDWARDCDLILWTHTPIFEQVAWAHKHGVETAVFSLWHELRPHDRRVYRELHAVISPSHEAARFLMSRWNIRRSYAAPYDPGTPFMRKHPRLRSTGTWVLLPLFDREPWRTEATALEISDRMLKRYPDTHLTVAYNSSHLVPFATRRLKQLQRGFPDRVRVLRRCRPAYRPILFGEHDLTLWPTHAENTGMTGLTSLAMGTPVLAYAFPPVSEFLNPKNSVRIPCRTTTNELGVPLTAPDYEAFEHGLWEVLDSPSDLRRLQETVSYGLLQRRKAFGDVLARCLSA